MLKFMLGNQDTLTIKDILTMLGIGTPEARASMRQTLIDDPVVPNKFVDEIVDLGLQAGEQAAIAALEAIDRVVDLADNIGVRQAIGQIGVQISQHVIAAVSQSMVATLMEKVVGEGESMINLATNAR